MEKTYFIYINLSNHNQIETTFAHKECAENFVNTIENLQGKTRTDLFRPENKEPEINQYFSEEYLDKVGPTLEMILIDDNTDKVAEVIDYRIIEGVITSEKELEVRIMNNIKKRNVVLASVASGILAATAITALVIKKRK